MTQREGLEGRTLADDIEKLRAAFAPVFAKQAATEAEAVERDGAAAAAGFAATGAVLDHLGGNCPVQAEGVVDGQRFYFRARGDSWELWVGAEADWWTDRAWSIERDYGDWPDAGWMTTTEALGFIVDGIKAYRARATLSEGAGKGEHG